jgi:hypothetical protein
MIEQCLSNTNESATISKSKDIHAPRNLKCLIGLELHILETSTRTKDGNFNGSKVQTKVLLYYPTMLT